jgi:hypothetical protein
MQPYISALFDDDIPWKNFFSSFDGFTSTFQDKLFKGYNMDIYNQVFYVTLCSSFLSMSGETPCQFWQVKVWCNEWVD